MLALDVLVGKNAKYFDVLYGIGIGIAPFKKILHINLDFSMSYGIVAWNNFSGLLKPHIALHIPLTKKKEDKPQLLFVLSGGLFYRYSYKIIGFMGSDGYYKNSKGYFLNAGFALGL